MSRIILIIFIDSRRVLCEHGPEVERELNEVGMVNGNPSDHTVQLNVACQLQKWRQDAFVSLLRELIPVALGDSVVYLRAVYIVEDNALENTVNTIIRDIAKSTKTYEAGPNPVGAVAVPVEDTDGLGCYIVFTKKELNQLTSRNHHPLNLVSSILEELLHVRVYARTWQIRGRLWPIASDLTWKEDLFLLCTRFHDEYIVGRTKAALISTTPLGYHQGQMTTFTVFYPDSLAPILRRARNALTQLISTAVAENAPVNTSWITLQAIVYRGIFEPLARDAAFRDGNIEKSPIEFTATETTFYRNTVETYWLAIHRELDRSFTSDLTEIDIALDRMIDVLESFLAYIGITFQLQPDDFVEIRIDPTMFPVL